MTNINPNLPPNFTSSPPQAPTADPNNGAFNAGVNKLIADGFKNLLFGGIGNIPGISGKGDDSDPKMATFLEYLQRILALYASLKNGTSTEDPHNLAFSIEIIMQAMLQKNWVPASLKDIFEKMANAFNTLGKTPNATNAQILAIFEDSNTNFFSGINDWFSDNQEAITDYLYSSSTSLADKEALIINFVGVLSELMTSPSFNMGQGLDNLFFGVMGSQLGVAFPDILFDYFLKQSGGDVQKAKELFNQFLNNLPTTTPAGIPNSNYQEFLSELHDYINNPNLQPPSSEELEVDLEDLSTLIAQFLSNTGSSS